jgi:hypothetical protein
MRYLGTHLRCIWLSKEKKNQNDWNQNLFFLKINWNWLTYGTNEFKMVDSFKMAENLYFLRYTISVLTGATS